MTVPALPDRLSVVAVPIGNVGDLSPRAVEALTVAQFIFCEDTRKTSDLLKRAKIESRAKLIAMPGDSEREADWHRYCAPESREWVIVSDAGTPLVNDPGQALLSFCRERGVAVRAIPGASAPIVAWQWSGGFGLPFVFGGFAPKVSAQGQSKWEKFFPRGFLQGTFCFFDTRHQILETLAHLEREYPEAELFIAREMTKIHEALHFGTAATLRGEMQKLIDADRVGELCLLLDFASLPQVKGEGLSADELTAFRSASTKDASKMLAKWTGLSSRDAYKRLCDES